MKQKDLSFFKDLLTNWLDELLEHADDTVNRFRASDDHLTDPLDQGLIDSERFVKLRIRTRESMLIKKIQRSLLDIENGEYGICTDCGEDISIKRLKIRPVATRCIRCKTKQEQMERAVGF
jgi:DnaK suppressor protein